MASLKTTYQVEYIWLGGDGEFRSKVRCFLSYTDVSPQIFNRMLITDWNYDGSSTGQATTENSEVILVPVRTYSDRSDPTRYYTLCETFIMQVDISGNTTRIPHKTNLRNALSDLHTQIDTLDIWFGFEQEFFIFDLMRNSILGVYDDMPEQGQYYCNIQAIKDYPYDRLHPRSLFNTRTMTEAITKRCIDLELGITGWNLEVAPGQTEIQIFGHGIKACDDLMMLRYLTHRVLADHAMTPIFDPKPLGSKWNGTGLHTNVSTEATRKRGGLEVIYKYLQAFEATHTDHIAVYGTGNEERLTGIHETSSMSKFTWSVGGRNTSVRIPRQTAEDKMGYFEDRRPAGNACPYVVAKRILDTIINTP